MWIENVLEFIFILFILLIPPTVGVLIVYDSREIINKIKKLKNKL